MIDSDESLNILLYAMYSLNLRRRVSFAHLCAHLLLRLAAWRGLGLTLRSNTFLVPLLPREGTATLLAPVGLLPDVAEGVSAF